MENNLFKDAKFGDKYVTKDGRMVLFSTDDVTGVFVFYEGVQNAVPYHYDGRPKSSKYSHYCSEIVGKWEDGSVMVKDNPIETDLYDIKDKVKSLETVAKQLRDEKHIGISIEILGEGQVNGENGFLYGCFITNLEDYIENPNKGYKIFNTYEDALSAGIDKAFELIKQNNNENEKEIQS